MIERKLAAECQGQAVGEQRQQAGPDGLGRINQSYCPVELQSVENYVYAYVLDTDKVICVQIELLRDRSFWKRLWRARRSP